MNKAQAYAEWLNWLDSNFPGSKAKILQRVSSGLGQDDAEDEAWYEQVVQAATVIVPTYYNYKMQSKLIDAQIERARAGQAPLDPTYFRTAGTVGPTVTHQLDTGMSETTQKMLVFGGLALAAVYLFYNR